MSSQNINNQEYGIDENLLSKIVELILNYKMAEKIVIFGSRADMNFKNTSDIDIAIFGKDWEDRDINVIKFMLDETIKTPLKFDVLNFNNISKESLKANILNKGRILYDSRKD